MGESPIVTIKQGQLCGKSEVTKTGFKFNTFQGIPYAKPPIGKLRFKAPQPADNWQGIRDATQEGDECYCFDAFEGQFCGSEDCLFLNVFTPTLPTTTSSLKPVMVWIHGGGYTFGSSKRVQYGPEYLIEKDIVLVTINYRLGALGFLALEDTTLGVPGNAGLKDQVLALKWVQENIAVFGGDPNNVTIFGESAGGASAHLHMLSPMSKGLFHKAIMQSGSALSPWSVGQRSGYIFAEHLGLKPQNDTQLLEMLQGVSKEELLAAQNKHIDVMSPSVIRSCAPVIDTPHSEPSFLPDDPMNILKSGVYSKVPILIGYNSEEGLLFKMVEDKLGTDLQYKNFEEAIPVTYGIEKGVAKSQEIAKRIKDFYYGKEEPSEENKHIFYKLASHTYFVRNIFQAIEETLKTSKEKIFLYRLSLECELNAFSKLVNMKGLGVAHADDLFYLFPHALLSPEITPGSIEELSIQRLTTWWTNFAKYGDPNGNQKDDKLIVWPCVNATSMKCMDINHDLKIKENPEGKYSEFWRTIENYCQNFKNNL